MIKPGTRGLSLKYLLAGALLITCIGVRGGAREIGGGSTKRLKIGLVLSGGGARGVAHVGVLEWMEQHRIPVDYLAGASMGGLVGGIYAMGMPMSDMRPFLRSLNWDELFSSGPAFDQIAFRRKEDKRSFQVGIEMGYRQGLSLPLGVSSAHYIGLLFDRLTLPYSDMKSFDDLPIPYRCVATDFLKARTIVLKDGSLGSALRATMSIPGVFPPVQRDGMVLVDGGLLNNIPTDVIREMKPDVVIAVDVGSKLGDMASIGTLPGILQQSITVMTIDGDRRNLRLADIIVAPELGELSVLDFSTIDQVADKGYQAAQAKAAVLDKFSLSESEWEDYLAQRRSRIRRQADILSEIRITGVDPEAQKILSREFDDFVGKPLDSGKLESVLTRLTGQGRYESLGYDLISGDSLPGKRLLEIRVKPKPYAPPTINMGVEIDGSEVNAINFTIGARVTFYDVGWYGSEWRNDIKLGFGNLFATEYFKPFGRSGLFVAPRATYRRERQGLYLQGVRILENEAEKIGAGIDLGLLGERSELRAGYEYTRVNSKTRIGVAGLPEFNGNINLARLRFAFDGQNSPTVPERGVRFISEARWYFSAPDTGEGFLQLELRGSSFKPLTERGSIFGALSAGASYNKSKAVFQQFLIGGPFRYGALNRDEIRADNFGLGTVGYLHRLTQLPAIVGGKIYAGGWIDYLYTSGGLNSQYDSQRNRTAISTGLVMDTKLGPVSLIGTYGEGGRGRVYFALGRFF
ncbi:MAG: patatin-like phospholipase family protein [Acidobacteria bacterium]|nr:patatin-like phospholipase family protein [Acidobacteriota bacterium]